MFEIDKCDFAKNHNVDFTVMLSIHFIPDDMNTNT